MLISSVQPTFIIADIKFDEVYKKYCEGHYNTLTLDSIKSGRPKIVSKIKKKEFVSEDDTKERYVLSDNRGIKISFVNVMKPSTVCQWCRRPMTNVDQKVSIPISIHPTDDNSKTIFNGHGTYCTFECCYADLNKTYKNNIKFKNSSTYLNFLFERLHPNANLKQAPEFILHECNGGPLTDEEFHSNTHTYHNTGRYKIIDSVSTYIVR